MENSVKNSAWLSGGSLFFLSRFCMKVGNADIVHETILTISKLSAKLVYKPTPMMLMQIVNIFVLLAMRLYADTLAQLDGYRRFLHQDSVLKKQQLIE